MIRRRCVVLGALVLGWVGLLMARPAAADERIRAYDIAVEVRTDGSLDVTERISVRAEGSRIRRGIYRDFPTRYEDRFGNRVLAGFELLDVRRNGQPEPHFTESVANGIRINTGNDDLLRVPADYTFTLRYRTTRQLGFFADHDELYWNAIGTGWIFPIDQGQVTVRLPKPVPVADLRAEGYTGPQGAKDQAYRADLPEPGVARWRLTSGLSPNEGLTIVLGFPKGMVPEPGLGQRLWWLLADNRAVLVALAGFAGLLAFCVWRWRQVGRDPRKGVIIPRYEPPAGLAPADLRFVRRMGYDTRCFSADVLAMAVAGDVRIHHEDGWLSDGWGLERTGNGSPSASPAQRKLLAALFPGGEKRIELRKSNATKLSAAQRTHTSALDKELQPRYFRRNASSTIIAAAIVIATWLLASFVSGGSGVPAMLVVLATMVVTVIVFRRLVRAPTKDGRALLDEIEGLKLYLSVAEREELERLPGPGAPPALDAKRYEALLPYAVALEVEEAWTAKFTAAVGAAAAAAATAGIAWYRGSGSANLGNLTRAVGSSLSSQIASSSSPPGSRSGGGGRGSSGGGGGGGGGGGR
jgi:uncharacterized membrane protein YgcG